MDTDDSPYTRGDRIALVSTDDPSPSVQPGDEGTVDHVLKTATQHVVRVNWDNGSKLIMCLDAGDRIRLITPAQQATAEPATPSAQHIADPAAFRAQFDEALRTGPARVDRILTRSDNNPGQVCVIAADRTLYWFLYLPSLARAYVGAVQHPGQPAEIPTGAGCTEHGFRLAGDHPHLVFELLALTHHDLTVVRGHPGAFIGIGMP